MSALPIQETFYTWQGEGMHLGRPAYFIRTYGCPVHCPWCDSAGTWHPDYKPEKLNRIKVSILVEAAVRAQPEFVVVTGGEPTIHDLEPLTTALHNAGIPVHLETSGAFGIRGDFDWITLSPKRWKLPLTETLAQADEIKIIVETEDCIEFWRQKLEGKIRTNIIWLHPEWSKRSDFKVINAINEAVKLRRASYRAGYQLHKLYQVDQLDPRSEKPVPLGGNLDLGY